LRDFFLYKLFIIMDFIPNEEMIIDWFNKRYDQNVEKILNGGFHLFL